MANVLIEQAHLEDIADAIRAKNGLSVSYRVSEMATAISNLTIGSGGSGSVSADELFKAVVEGTVTEINENTITKIGNGAFRNQQNLKSITFENVEIVDVDAFARCPRLATLNLPKATELEDYAFGSCQLLTSINLPKVKKIRESCFSSCVSLTEIDLPDIEFLAMYAFGYCSNLKTVRLGSIGSSGFHNASDVFTNCINLSLVDIRGAYEANVCELNMLPKVGGYYTVPSIIFRSNTLQYPLKSFVEKATLKPDSYIYVPKALLADYKSHENWTFAKDNFRAIEDYPSICG